MWRSAAFLSYPVGILASVSRLPAVLAALALLLTGVAGCGLGTVGTAAVTDRLSAMGRVSSLYVNGFNTVARRAYSRIGFRQVGSFATVLF